MKGNSKSFIFFEKVGVAQKNFVYQLNKYAFAGQFNQVVQDLFWRVPERACTTYLTRFHASVEILVK